VLDPRCVQAEALVLPSTKAVDAAEPEAGEGTCQGPVTAVRTESPSTSFEHCYERLCPVSLT
jgi:hypothetical protein